MTVAAQSIIQDAQTILIDTTGTRSPASELVRHLNDMQHAIRAARPDATATSATLTLLAGVLQTLPSTAAALIELTNLAAGTKGALRQCRREDLDAILPGWRAATQSATITDYVYDPRHPRRFEVYPPAIVSTQVEGIVSAYPIDVGAPSGDGKSYTTVSGNIGLPDEYRVPLLHLVLARAYLKDHKALGNAALAKMHLDMAVSMVGEELRNHVGMQPKSGEDASA